MCSMPCNACALTGAHEHVQLYLYQMLQGIAYCHSHRCAALSSSCKRGSFSGPCRACAQTGPVHLQYIAGVPFSDLWLCQPQQMQ